MIFILITLLTISGCALILKYVYKEDYSWKEYTLAVLVNLIIIISGYFIAIYMRADDTQILSGKVIGKEKDRVACRHAYPCNCHKSGKATTCSVCHLHPYDYDWNVKTTVKTVTINSIDSQGLKEPPRWTQVQMNEPVSLTDSYQNFLKGVPETIWRRESQEKTPEYPDKIYDYYKIDRVVNFGSGIPPLELRKLNERISESLKEVAPIKQVNIVIVLTNKSNGNFSKNLQAAWLNGKKNDVVVVVGSSSYPLVDWAEVFGWSKNDIMNITTRDDIITYGKIDENIINIIIGNINKYWQRKPMEDYEYLRYEMEPSNTGILLIIAISLLSMVGVSVFFIKNEVI